MKNTLLSTYSTNILVVSLLIVNMKNSLTSKNLKMCDPILVTLLKTRPHYSQSSHENATPSSGTSPVVSYKEVPPPPGKLTGSFHCMSKCTSFLPNILEIIPFKLFLFPLFDRISRDSTLSLAVFKKSRSEIIVAKKRRRGQIVLQHSWTNETMRSHVSALQRAQWSWFLEFASVASRYHGLTR